MTYLLISIPFLVLGLAVAWWRRNASRRPLLVTSLVMAALLILTAIFDNAMIWAELVGYGEEQRLGFQLGLVPVEDFFYPVFVALVIPALWPDRPGRRSS